MTYLENLEEELRLVSQEENDIFEELTRIMSGNDAVQTKEYILIQSERIELECEIEKII